MNVSSDVATTPGWYGKLPTLGDFASRRLEADFIEPWDLWLGERLQRQRETLGDGWLDAYLDTPPWRFLLSPGVLPGGDPGRVFAGVLVPSVDRVGRHFPLTLAASLPHTPSIAGEFDALLAWLHRLEDTALDALQGDWSIDDLERALADLPPPADEAATAAEDRLAGVRRALAAAVAGRGGFVDIAPAVSRAELAAVLSNPPDEMHAASAAPGPVLHGIALWIADSPGRPLLLVSDGLPGDAAFARMFAGGGGLGSARGVASPGLPEEDDPLATLPLPLGAPLDVAARYGQADETDLLGMFKDVGSTNPEDAGHGLPPGDDILALFGAGDQATHGETHASDAPREDDILGLFSGQPEASSPHEQAQESNDPHTEAERRPKEPDILDLFGGPPAEPGTGKAP